MTKAKNPKMGRPVHNRYKVPKKQWAKWSNFAKGVFNEVMDTMRPSQQWVFLHPKATPAPREHWETTRWNAAWIAAGAANGEPQITTVIDVVLPKRAKRKAPKKVTRRVREPAVRSKRYREFGRAVDRVVSHVK